MENRKKRIRFFILVLVLLLAAFALVPLKLTTVKMLPFDNKSELQVVIDLPEGSSLEKAAALTREIGQYLATVPEVTNYQSYIGTSAPFNFNGLVRHYFFRTESSQADIQVNFVTKEERKAQSHEIAKRIRPAIKKLGDAYQARTKIVEIPPGPPVLSTLVAEVYGPRFERQIEIAKEIKDLFARTPGWLTWTGTWRATRRNSSLMWTRKKPLITASPPRRFPGPCRTVLNGTPVGLAHIEKDKEPVELLLRAPLAERAGTRRLGELTLNSSSGRAVPLSELVRVRDGIEDKTIYRKNLKRVVYVLGDVAGTAESPVYPILKMKKQIKEMKLPEGYELQQYSAIQPSHGRQIFHEMGWGVAYHL